MTSVTYISREQTRQSVNSLFQQLEWLLIHAEIDGEELNQMVIASDALRVLKLMVESELEKEE